MLGKHSETVIGSCGEDKLKFIRIASALEAKTLKNRERRTFRDGADVEKSCFLDNVVGVVSLVDRNENTHRVACELNYSVTYHTVILLAVI